MMQVAYDFLDESAALAGLLRPLNDDAFETPTLFKGWTFNNILRHLHVWNRAADMSLSDSAAFADFMAAIAAGVKGGRLPEFEAAYLDGLAGEALLDAWATQFRAMTPRFANADPKARVQWVGPEMSVISSITARLMETWAHGQAIYDALGTVRRNTDRIGNIVRLGVNTFGWTYKTRRMAVPAKMPFVRLTAPSGAIWDYGEPDDAERIEGDAAEFCQVVTQCRNVGDTALRVTGPVASEWMAMAQCFAGPPQAPPGVGERRMA